IQVCGRSTHASLQHKESTTRASREARRNLPRSRSGWGTDMECTAHDLTRRVISLSRSNSFCSSASMLALGALLATGAPADAQTATPSAASTLPAVTVDAPKPDAQRAA